MFVLVVTPEADTSDTARQALEANGWWVTAVEDRETALRSASDQAPQLVLVDAELTAAGELVKIFASRHGGPGALVVAPESGEVDEASEAADEVLSRPVDGDALVAAAQRLLKQPQPVAEASLPTPGRVLNAKDIFGDLLLEMEGGSGAADPPDPPAASEEEEALRSLAEGQEPDKEVEAESEEVVGTEPGEEAVALPSEASLETVAVAIPAADHPERLVDQADAAEAAEEDMEAAARQVAEEVEEVEEQDEPAEAEETEKTDVVDEVEETETPRLDGQEDVAVEQGAEADREPTEEPRLEEESREEPPPQIEPEIAAAMPDDDLFAADIDEALEESLGPPPAPFAPPGLGLVVPPPSAEFSEGLEPPLAFEGELDLEIPEPEPVSEDAGDAPREAVAAAVETQAALEAEPVPEPEETETRLSVRDRLAAALGGGEVEASEEATDSSVVAVASVEELAAAESTIVRSPRWRPRSLPGGVRFWLGMAAGLLVFVLTTLLLDHFFGSPGPRPPQEVVAPADELGAVDLEELVDREMAKREAELRESLLEEERRLQGELDELDGDDGQ